MSWIEGARYVLEHGFVMFERDGSWHPPTEKDWRAIETTETEEVFGRSDVDAYGRPRPDEPESEGVILDHFTASMLVQIHDALGPEARAKFDGMHIVRAVDIGWKLVKRVSV